MSIVHLLPVIGILVVGAIPFVRYAQKQAAEATAAGVLGVIHQAQERFHAAAGGYATDLASLTTACPGQHAATLTPAVVEEARGAAYEIALRASQAASARGTDCHGRPVTSDFYAAVRPASAGSAGQRAFAVTASGRIFLFYDGVPPREEDMAAGGLATPLEAADTFTIP